MSKRSRPVDGRIRRADGAYRWCTLRQNPLFDEHGNVIRWYGVVLDIEDRKCAEDALQRAQSALVASEQNLRLIVDSLPILAWGARPDGAAEFVNERWATYAGVDAEHILAWGFLEFIHPDDRERLAKVWKHDLLHSDQSAHKARIRRHDGEYRWFYFSSRKITDASGLVRWVGANIDIEDLQRAEDALKANERNLQLIIDTIPAMSWSATPDGMVDFWSRNLLDFCGFDFKDIVGAGFYRIFHPDDLEVMRECWERVRANKRGEEIDGRILRADGEYRWFTLRQNPLLNADGDVIKWYGALIEIEDRKRAEEELRRSQGELARVARITTLGELAVSIAHEINQPLMAIVTNAGTCLRWLSPAQLDVGQARRAAERIVRDGHRAGDIIAGIRGLARKSPPRMEPMNLGDAIRDVLLVLKGELSRREVEARFETAAEPMIVDGDRTQLQQVLLNLVMNGAEAMAESSGRRRLTIRARTRATAAEISVIDAGPGLDKGDAAAIFEPFYSTKIDGIGMGLSICRSIVEAHRGIISAANNPSHGSCFRFMIPLATEAADR